MADANFVRRCHVCGTVIQAENKVDKCSACGINMAPFFYFDEAKMATFSESLIRPPLLPGEYAPVLGISVIWK